MTDDQAWQKWRNTLVALNKGELFDVKFNFDRPPNPRFFIKDTTGNYYRYRDPYGRWGGQTANKAAEDRWRRFRKDTQTGWWV